MASNLKTVGTQTMPQPVAALAPSAASAEPARPAALAPEAATPLPEDVVSGSESDVEPLTFSDYEPPSSPSSSDSVDTDEDDDRHRDKFIVFEASLDELMKFCRVCGSPVVTRSHFTTGTMVTYRMGCLQGHDHTWQSQPVVNRAPLGNMLLSGAIQFSGLSYTGVSDRAQCLGLQFLSHSSYHDNQTTTLFPVIKEACELECEGAAMDVGDDGPATLAGDARCSCFPLHHCRE